MADTAEPTEGVFEVTVGESIRKRGPLDGRDATAFHTARCARARLAPPFSRAPPPARRAPGRSAHLTRSPPHLRSAPAVKFKPASVPWENGACLEIDADGGAQYTVRSSPRAAGSQQGGGVRFNGNYKPCPQTECVLIQDGAGAYRLERLRYSIRGLHVARDGGRGSGAAVARARAQPAAGSPLVTQAYPMTMMGQHGEPMALVQAQPLYSHAAPIAAMPMSASQPPVDTAGRARGRGRGQGRGRPRGRPRKGLSIGEDLNDEQLHARLFGEPETPAAPTPRAPPQFPPLSLPASAAPFPALALPSPLTGGRVGGLLAGSAVRMPTAGGLLAGLSQAGDGAVSTSDSDD
jgi:hypothetical protein